MAAHNLFTLAPYSNSMKTNRLSIYRIRDLIGALWPAQVEPERWQAIIWTCVLAIFTTMICLWAFITRYTVQRYEGERDVYPVTVFITAPKYLSVDEDEEINLAIQNDSDVKTDATFRLVNSGPVIGLVALAESNKFYTGVVNKREHIYRQLKIRYPFHPDRNHAILNQPADLSLWGCTAKDTEQKILDLDVRLAPIPRARWLSNLLGTALIGIMALLCHDSWKQLNSSDKKDED